jgi:serine/threonine-protein kinase
MPACPAFNSERRRESEKPTGNQREKIDGKERGSLHMRDCSSQYMVKLGPLGLTYGTVGTQSLVFFSEEFIDGISVKSVAQQGRQLSIPEVVKLGLQMTDAISALWEIGKVHRDIKPGNIMREAASGNFILLDAGLAFDIVGESLSAGFPVGTMPYFSPEQFDYSNRRILDFRSDMFSLGTTLYEAATRRHPFWAPGDSAAVLYSRITKAAPTRPRDLNQEIPEGLERVILRMLGKSPHLRYRKCAQLISDLREALGT